MASTGINNGTLFTIFIDNTAVTHSTNHSMSISQGLRDSSSKDSGGWKDNLPAQRSWTGSGEAFFAENSSYGFTDLFATINSRGSVNFKWRTGVTGDNYYAGTAYLTELSQEAPLEDNQSISYSLEGTGAITEHTLT